MLIAEGFTPPENCKLSFTQELAAYIQLDKSQSEAWASWFERCLPKLPNEVSKRYMITQTSQSDWQTFLQVQMSQNSELQTLEKIVQIRTEQLDRTKRLQLIIEKILNFKRTGDHAKEMLLLERYKTELESFPNGLLKKFGELIFALEVGNKALVQKHFEEVVHWESRVLPFYGVNLPLSDETWKSVDFTLSRASKLISDRVLVRAFATQVLLFVDASKLPQFLAPLDLNWSLNELRTLTKSPWYSRKFPAFLFGQLAGRVSQNEVVAVFEELTKKKSIDLWDMYDLSIFTDWFPSSDKHREDFFKLAQKLKSQKEPYLKELLIRLADNVVIRKEFEERGLVDSKALFKLKRGFYQELLYQGMQVDYSIYQLLVLGDENREYLWWYALNPFRVSRASSAGKSTTDAP